MKLLEVDFSQIEPRLVAHITGDKTFTDAFLNNKDIYSELVEGTGRKRQDGKTFMLALLYGAQPKKLASVFECSEPEAENIINSIMSKLPAVQAWIERTKINARRNEYIETMFGRRIPLPLINQGTKWDRLHWERVAVNASIQGSAAEIMKMGLIELRKAGYLPVLTVHDSYLTECEDDIVEYVRNEQVDILENIVELNVPLKVSYGIGDNWAECKELEVK